MRTFAKLETVVAACTLLVLLEAGCAQNNKGEDVGAADAKGDVADQSPQESWPKDASQGESVDGQDSSIPSDVIEEESAQWTPPREYPAVCWGVVECMKDCGSLDDNCLGKCESYFPGQTVAETKAIVKCGKQQGCVQDKDVDWTCMGKKCWDELASCVVHDKEAPCVEWVLCYIVCSGFKWGETPEECVSCNDKVPDGPQLSADLSLCQPQACPDYCVSGDWPQGKEAECAECLSNARCTVCSDEYAACYGPGTWSCAKEYSAAELCGDDLVCLTMVQYQLDKLGACRRSRLSLCTLQQCPSNQKTCFEEALAGPCKDELETCLSGVGSGSE